MNNRNFVLLCLCTGLFVFALAYILLDGSSMSIWVAEKIIIGLQILD